VSFYKRLGPMTMQRKPGALRNGAPFVELPEGLRRLQAVFLRQPGGDRETVEILALAAAGPSWSTTSFASLWPEKFSYVRKQTGEKR
jgi:hypothetical protein